SVYMLFSFNDTSTTCIYPLSLHDALPISLGVTGYGYGEAYRLAMDHARELELVAPITELYYSFEYNFYGAGFGDHASNEGNAWIFFHGTDGRLLGTEIPGQGTLGERFFQLQAPIHGGRIL